MKHDPAHAAAELSAKLASRARHVAVLLGAGTAKAAGLPDLVGLQNAVLEALDEEKKAEAERLFEGRNLEEVLSRLRRIASLLEGGGEFDGFSHDTARAMDEAITRAIIPAIDVAGKTNEPFRKLAIWATGDSYRLPLEIFTVNYDLLIESALEDIGASYFDGFVGHLRGHFRPELVESIGPESPGLPPSFVRLWKLHGSVNWALEVSERGRGVIRLGAPAPDGKVAAIYPSDEKYADSRRVPFVVLMDRFRRSLAEPESLMVISGYSFGDEHINELIFDAAIHNPRSETIAVCYSTIPEVLAERALETRNLTVWSRSEAIIGGVRADWSETDEAPSVWAEGQFRLSDFGHLASYLAQQTGEADGGA